MVCRLPLLSALIFLFVTAFSTGTEFERGKRASQSPDAKPDAGRATSLRESANDEEGTERAETIPKAPIAGRNPRVLFITMKECERCTRELARLRRPGGDFDAMRSRGWKIGPENDNHLQIVDRSDIPEIIEQLNVREFPTVACIEKGEVVRSFKHGCTTPLDAWTFGFLLNGKNERPRAAIPEAVQVATTGSYRLRGNHWSVDGDWEPSRETVISHLRGPNHASQLASSWRIESWSYEELRSLHDDLHERELGTSSAGVSTGGYSSGSFGYESAPTGRTMNEFGAGRKLLGR